MVENMRTTGLNITSILMFFNKFVSISDIKLLEMEQIIELIDDKANLNQLKATVESVRAEVVSTLNYNFDLWKERSVAAIKSGELRY